MPAIIGVFKVIWDSSLNKVSAFFTLVATISLVTGYTFNIPRQLFIIGILLLFFVVLINTIVKQQKQFDTLSKRHVDFDIKVKTDEENQARFINSQLFDANRRFMDVGKLEFSAKLDVKNTRTFPTIIKFEILDPDTDLPIIQKKYEPDLRSNYSVEGKDKLKLEPSQWNENFHFRSEIQLDLSPIEKRVPEIGKASYFRLKVRAIQSDTGGYFDFVIEIRNPANELEQEIEKEVTNWINHPNNRPGVAGGGEIFNYLKLLWKR
jgi:hypothetical protein